MIAQPMEDAAASGRGRRVCRVLLPLFLLSLGACTQVAPAPSTKQAELHTTSSPMTPEQTAAAARWAADKKAAEERAAVLWAADKRRAEMRAAEKSAAAKKAAEKKTAEKKTAEKRAAEQRAAEQRAAAKKAAEKSAAEQRAEAERREAERLVAELDEARRVEAELAAAERAEAENATAKGAEDTPAEVAEQTPPPSKRDWSAVKYPWEEGAEPLLPSTETAKAEKGSEKGGGSKVAESREAQPSPPVASTRDWSEVKYPWESAGEGASAHLTMMEAANKAGIVKRLRRKNSSDPLPVELTKVSVGSSQLELVNLPGGRFTMGSEGGESDERPLREVVLRPFLIGRYEVTQREWRSVMGNNPSFFSDCADCPVDNVSWDEIQNFLDKLNRRTGKRFRLPTEAEWEYACKAGGEGVYCGGSDETRVAWFFQNSSGRPQPVGQLLPNRFGIYDMSGNIYEWVADCWHDSYDGAPADGSVWTGGDCQRRVLRGGAWYYAAAYAGATYRNANTPSSRFIIYGFRLAHDN